MTGEIASVEGSWGPWLAAVLGLVWVVALVLLSVHVVRRRTGWYARNAAGHEPPRVFIWGMDALIFVLVCFFVYLVIRSFSPMPVSWLFRIGFVSGVFALMCIAIVIREDLSMRRAAAATRENAVKSTTSDKPRQTRTKRKGSAGD